MLDRFNNPWILLFCAFLIYSIIKKICKINKPFDEQQFMKQIKNQDKLKENFSLDFIKRSIPSLASYYVGLN
jgi:hypothetical protein